MADWAKSDWAEILQTIFMDKITLQVEVQNSFDVVIKIFIKLYLSELFKKAVH